MVPDLEIRSLPCVGAGAVVGVLWMHRAPMAAAYLLRLSPPANPFCAHALRGHAGDPILSSSEDVTDGLGGDSGLITLLQYLALSRALSFASISRVTRAIIRSPSHSVAARPHHQSSRTVSS